MDEKKKVYVETSVISNLTARPSPRLIEAGRQIATIEWWNRAISEYELFGSFVVEREASNGDPDAAARLRGQSYEKHVNDWGMHALKSAHQMNCDGMKKGGCSMEEESVMEELWRIKEEIAAQYASFKEFAADMLRLQAQAHPELATA